MAKRQPSKTVIQPDQYDLFARVRARFADIGAIGSISLLLAVSFCGLVLTSLFAAAEDAWFRPTLMIASIASGCILALAVAIEFARSMRWVENKDVLASMHGLVILGVLLVGGWMLSQQYSIPQARARQRAEETAAKIEAARLADLECQTRRAEEIELTTKRRADMRVLLQRCKDEFERSRTIFTDATVEQHCKGRRATANAAERDFKVANERICSTGAK